jgi:hypothetical protein
VRSAARRALVLLGGAGALVVVAIALGVGGPRPRAAGRGPRCWIAVEDADAPPGWRRVALPSGAPSLAAPAGVPQFRSDEDAVVWTVERGGVPAERSRMGRARFVVDLSAREREARHAALRFRAPLDGARLEVRDGAGELIFDRRISGAEARVDWEGPARRLGILVHHHLRPAPRLAAVRLGVDGRAAALAEAGDAFRLPGSLYYRHPGGAPVELCDEPARQLEVAIGELSGPVEARALSPAPSNPLAELRRTITR